MWLGWEKANPNLWKASGKQYLKRNEMLPLLLFSQQRKLDLKLLPEYFTK